MTAATPTVTRKQLVKFHKSVTSAEQPLPICEAIREFSRLWRWNGTKHSDGASNYFLKQIKFGIHLGISYDFHAIKFWLEVPHDECDWGFIYKKPSVVYSPLAFKMTEIIVRSYCKYQTLPAGILLLRWPSLFGCRCKIFFFILRKKMSSTTKY